MLPRGRGRTNLGAGIAHEGPQAVTERYVALELRVEVGDSVSAGDTVLVLEAMKMEHPMRATESGTVIELRVAEGDQVEAGTLLLVVESGGEDDARNPQT